MGLVQQPSSHALNTLFIPSYSPPPSHMPPAPLSTMCSSTSNAEVPSRGPDCPTAAPPPPSEGDVIIYPYVEQKIPWGHVGVIRCSACCCCCCCCCCTSHPLQLHRMAAISYRNRPRRNRRMRCHCWYCRAGKHLHLHAPFSCCNSPLVLNISPEHSRPPLERPLLRPLRRPHQVHKPPHLQKYFNTASFSSHPSPHQAMHRWLPPLLHPRGARKRHF